MYKIKLNNEEDFEKLKRNGINYYRYKSKKDIPKEYPCICIYSMNQTHMIFKFIYKEDFIENNACK